MHEITSRVYLSITTFYLIGKNPPRKKTMKRKGLFFILISGRRLEYIRTRIPVE